MLVSKNMLCLVKNTTLLLTKSAFVFAYLESGKGVVIPLFPFLAFDRVSQNIFEIEILLIIVVLGKKKKYLKTSQIGIMELRGVSEILGTLRLSIDISIERWNR